MTKTSPLRALLLFLSCGAPLAASCARETNSFELDTGAGRGGQTAGGKSNPGNKPGAGSSSVAGTTGSAFGGTSAQGGAGSGGRSGAGGAEAAAGDSSNAGGGTGGSSTIPPDVELRASAVVLYQTSISAASVTRIEMKLNIQNKSPDPLPMTNVSIRYWFTAEATPTLHNYYTGPSVTPVETVFVDAGTDSYALMTFVGAGTITREEIDLNKSEIQLVIDNNTKPFTQRDDFSWDPTAAASKPNPKITMYLAIC